MLGRHARIHLQTHRISWVAHRKPHLIVITPLVAHRPSSSRQFSLSNITEPLNKAAGQLPDILQHQIPETVLNLSEAWVPTSLPTYTTGIFVFAVLTRLCFFTPWAYWARKRKWKLHEEIDPKVLAEFVHGWGPPLRTKLMRENVPPTEVRRIIGQNLDLRRKELIEEANLTLPRTVVTPALFTLPVFVIASSIMYSTASLPQIAANPALNEMFISLAGSGQDIAPALPIAIGIVSLLGLEVGTWSPKAIQSQRAAQLAAQAKAALEKEKEKDSVEIKPNALATGFFRLLSLARVPICVVLPGPVNIYWFVSSLFGLLEAGLFTFVEHLRAPTRWGRASPILKLSPAVLKARGFDLSTKTPLERAGIAYSQTAEPAKKRPLSLERGARAVFVKVFQASQLSKRASHAFASKVASVGTVLANPRIYYLKTRAWSRKMSQYYLAYWKSRWRRLRAMKLGDYWAWLERRRARIRYWSEGRWKVLAGRLAHGYQRALEREKIRRGEWKPAPPSVTPKWTTKSHK